VKNAGETNSPAAGIQKSSATGNEEKYHLSVAGDGRDGNPAGFTGYGCQANRHSW